MYIALFTTDKDYDKLIGDIAEKSFIAGCATKGQNNDFCKARAKDYRRELEQAVLGK